MNLFFLGICTYVAKIVVVKEAEDVMNKKNIEAGATRRPTAHPLLFDILYLAIANHRVRIDFLANRRVDALASSSMDDLSCIILLQDSTWHGMYMYCTKSPGRMHPTFGTRATTHPPGKRDRKSEDSLARLSLMCDPL